MPAAPYVRVEKHATVAAYQAAIRRHAQDAGVDFIDGMIHSPSAHVLSVGPFVETVPYANRYAWMTVYCRSALRRSQDYLRTPDYFFRYDNGVTNVHSRSALGRLVLGRFVHSSEIPRLAEKLRRWRPAEHAFLAWSNPRIAHFPLWCVPYGRVRDYEWLAPAVFKGVEDGRNVYRELEEAPGRLHGVKTLISHNYYAPEEFWAIWNRDNSLLQDVPRGARPRRPPGRLVLEADELQHGALAADHLRLTLPDEHRHPAHQRQPARDLAAGVEPRGAVHHLDGVHGDARAHFLVEAEHRQQLRAQRRLGEAGAAIVLGNVGEHTAGVARLEPLPRHLDQAGSLGGDLRRCRGHHASRRRHRAGRPRR